MVFFPRTATVPLGLTWSCSGLDIGQRALNFQGSAQQCSSILRPNVNKSNAKRGFRLRFPVLDLIGSALIEDG